MQLKSYKRTCLPLSLLPHSDIPLKKAVAGVRVGLLDSGLVINPTVEEMKVGTGVCAGF